MELLSELTPHWMLFPPNPERLEVSWGPGTTRTVLSLSTPRPGHRLAWRPGPRELFPPLPSFLAPSHLSSEGRLSCAKI